MTSSITQLSVTISRSANSAGMTVLPFAIVNDVPEFDIILGKGWQDWTEANSRVFFFAQKISNIPRPYNTEECTTTNVNRM